MPSSWAAHPNPALRLEIARYRGRGWKVHQLGERSAILVKPRRFSFAKYLLLTPLYVVIHLFERDQAMRIVADAAGTATWRTRIPVPHGGLGNVEVATEAPGGPLDALRDASSEMPQHDASPEMPPPDAPPGASPGTPE